MRQCARRRVLGGGGIALLGSLAGCSALPTDSPDSEDLSFEDAFENEGYGDAEPDPSLVVGARIGLYVTTYRHSWTDGPRDRDVLGALAESLVAIEKETPPG